MLFRSPKFSGPYPFGGSPCPSFHSIPSAHTSGYSANRFQEYYGGTQTRSSSKTPITGDLTSHVAISRPVSDSSVPKIHISERSSSPVSANIPSRPPLFESMESDIKSYITNRKDLVRQLQYELSWEEFLEFREHANKSVPGWEKLRYVITLVKLSTSLY